MGKACRTAGIAFGFLVACLIMTSCTQAMSDAVIIEYRRSGGIAGFNEALEIREDGTAILVSYGETKEFELEGDRYENLLELFDTADFLLLNGEYLPDSTCCDLFDYKIRYRGHTVHTMTTAVPAAIEPILAALDGIVREQLAR